MRGQSEDQGRATLTYPEMFVPSDHPLRRIKPIVDRALANLSPRFDGLYSESGRPSIPPETLLKSTLLIAFFSIRSESQFCERLRSDMAFKWFLDLPGDPGSFDRSTFSKNRSRLLDGDIARGFFEEVVREARERNLLSEEHFTVDGSQLEAWASHKSYRSRDEQDGDKPAGRNPDVDFRGERRHRDTHVSTTDPGAHLYRKGNGQAARPSYIGHVMTENRNGLIVDVELTTAHGRAERDAALAMAERSLTPGATLGADKGYDAKHFVEGLCELGVVPHVARRAKHSAIPEEVAQTPGYEVSQRRRKMVEESFGWLKTVGGRAQAPLHRRTGQRFLDGDGRCRVQPGARGQYRRRAVTGVVRPE